MNKTIKGKDYFGNEKKFIICKEFSVLHEWFAIGIDTTDNDKVSLFHINNDGSEWLAIGIDTADNDKVSLSSATNDDRKDKYTVLRTYSWSIVRNNDTFDYFLKEEISEVLKKVLTARVSCGMLTIEQIKGWLK